MRQDMFKVIVERPRVGGTRGKKRSKPSKHKILALADLDQNDSGAGEKNGKIKDRIKFRYDEKTLNENLNPLKRFLHKNVGRPWDKVFAEVCEHIDLDNTVKRHVREHIDQYVEIHIDMVDGVPHQKAATYKSYPNALRRGELWVHPETGLLCLVKREPKRVKKPKDLADLEKLALEYFEFAGVKIARDHRGFIHKEVISNVTIWQPLGPQHARQDINQGLYHWAWLQMSAHRKLKNFHSYFKELFKAMGE